MKNNRGFSLLELIVVVAIMAVLTSVLYPQVSKYIGKTKRSIDANTAHEIVRVLQFEEIFGASANIPEHYRVYALFWNKDTEVSEGSSNIFNCMFETMGELPLSRYDENLWWRINYYEGEMTTIYLVEDFGSVKGYEVYPDSSLYVNYGEKSNIVFEK